MGILKNIEEFKSDVKLIHGDKLFVADDAVYVNNKTPIKMICPKHGVKMMRPDNIMSGSGCKDCGYEQVSSINSDTPEKFISKAIKKHGKNAFDYSLAREDYGKKEKVRIICNTCGKTFEQRPALHVFGNGCPHCNKFPSKYTTESFKEHLKEMHPNIELIGDYPGDNDLKMKVRCKKHNYEWETTAHRLHQQKHGCKYCYGEDRASKIREEKEKEFKEFTDRFYKPLYDTSKIVYINRRTPVKLICPEHGEFEVKPSRMEDRLQGCPYCKESTLERKIRLLLLANNIKFEKEKCFDWLINKGKLFLDFYLPDYNIAIECQGEQHIIDRESIMNKHDNFTSRLKRDILKNELCEKNGINIIYVLNKVYSKKCINEQFNHIYDNAIFIEDIENDNSILIDAIKGEVLD